jgi:TMEM175 potassium channel family protein
MADPEIAGNAERMKFFTDAVVAIATTLLILPLLESVAEAARQHADTATYLSGHGDQLLSFVLSFVIIGRFWIGHERLFAHVERWTGPLMTLNQLWMLSIVFLPVATAVVGSMHTDAVQLLLYIGTMLASGVLLAAMQVVIRRTPATWAGTGGPPVERLVSSLVFLGLLLLALVVALAVPGVGYLALLVLLLGGPLEGLVERRWLGHRR